MPDYQGLYQAMQECENVLVLTGAGISTLSGIPDFRGSGGVYQQKWHGMDVEEVLSLDCFLKHPEYFYEWAQTFVYGLENYRPNIVHNTLVQWEQQGLISKVYTQNIDILHQKAGSKNLYELHGSPAQHYCLDCNAQYDYDTIAPIVRSNQVPRCQKCGGLVKPRIVFYGEMLDEDLLRQAYTDFSNADLVIVMGSSLTVHPAASLPRLATEFHARLAIVNSQPTGLDHLAQWRFGDLQKFCEISN